MTLVEQGLQHRRDATSHKGGQSLDFKALDESVDDLDFDARFFVQLLRSHDDAGQKISGADIGRLQLGGKVEDLRDGHALADQRCRQFALGGDELVELALDIEPEEHKAQLFGALGKSRRLRRCDAGSLGGCSRGAGKGGRFNLAGSRRDAGRRYVLRPSCVDSSRNEICA
jgi:hypothetical protein